MKKAFILICLTLYLSVGLAASVNGPGSVASGETHSYSYNDGTSVPSKLNNFSVSPNGTILNRYIAGGVYWADIKWNVAGPGTVFFTGGTSKAVTVSQGPTQTITAINITSTSFTARWNAITGASSYRLDVATDLNFSNILVGYNNLSMGASTNANVTGLTAGTTYYYRVRAVSSGGSVSVNSNTTSVVTLPPAPIVSDGTDITSGSFTANWSVVTVATGYKLDVSTTSGFSSFVSGYNNLSVTGTSYSVTGLTQNTTYYYRVRAVNGSAASANSSTKSVQTLFVSSVQGFSAVNSGETHMYSYNDGTAVSSRLSYFNVTPNGTILNRYLSGSVYWAEIRWDVAGPGTVYFTGGNSLAVTVSQSPPHAIDPINVTSSSFGARWDPSTGASSYQLDVATDAGFSNILPAYNSLSTTGTSVNVSGLTETTTYYYRVRAVSTSAGPSVNSNPIAVVTLPSPPITSDASDITSGSFAANWSSVATATGYRLDVSTNSSFTSFVSGYNNLSVTGTSYSVGGLAPTTTYHYRVRAVSGSTTSLNSNPTNVTTLLAASVQGNSNVMSEETHLYSYDDGTTVSSRLSYFNVTPNGTILNRYISNGKYWAEIIWTMAGPGTVYYNGGNSLPVTVSQSPPEAYTAINVATTSFTARWETLTGASTYQVDVSTTSNFSSILPAYNSLSTTSSSLNVTDLAQGTYYYRVRAVSASAGTSVNSNTISVTLLPTPPVALAANGITSNSFIANWQNTSGLGTSYKLYVSTNSSFSTYLQGYNGSTVSGTSATISGLDEKTTYYYKVQAVKSSGTSNFSNIVLAVNLTQNYILLQEALHDGVTSETQLNSLSMGEKLVSYSFFDGLGRRLQNVLKQQSPNQKDIVQPFVYDPFGREDTQYLPFTTGTDGWFKPDFLRKEDAGYDQSPQYQFYQTTPQVATDDRPYAETFFEASPINVVIKQAPAGDAWLPNNDALSLNDKGIKKRYEINDDEEVFILSYDISNGAISVGDGPQQHYSSGSLYRNVTYDEHNGDVVEYVNIEGRIICKKVLAYETGGQRIYASTYYVYDDRGNLVCVIQPEGIKNINEFIAGNATSRDAFLKRWAFRYKYDERTRMIMKQVPGAEPVYMVYDDRDRLVLTQDGNLRKNTAQADQKKWLFTKYDELNRAILTGIYTADSVLDQVKMQKRVNRYYNNQPTKIWGEIYSGNTATDVLGYTNNTFPAVTSGTIANPLDYLTVTFYDNYNFRSDLSGEYAYVNESLSETSGGIVYSQPATEFLPVKGMVTGTRARVLGGALAGEYTWLSSVNYYDNRYRVTQVVGDNYRGGTNRVTNVYDFAGKILKTKTTHYGLTFKDLVGVESFAGVLKKSVAVAAWSYGAASAEMLPTNAEGWVEFFAPATNQPMMIGFSETNVDANWTTIKYALYLNSNATIQVRENGASTNYLGSTPAYAAGDIFRIERKLGKINYYKNGLLLLQRTASSNALLIDVSINGASGQIQGLRSSFGSYSPKMITRRFEYDPAGRLIKTWHRINTSNEILLSYNSYNELGQLIDKKLHSTNSSATDARQSVDYRYNIRGWLTSMNNSSLSDNDVNDDTNDLFGFELGYNNSIEAGNDALFNGNISGIKWSNNLGLGDQKEKAYLYGYDTLSRIKSASYRVKEASWAPATNQGFSESGYKYDFNGNIRGLIRYDQRGSTAVMDNLAYDYGSGTTLSNRLLKVTDSGDKFKGFVDGTNTGSDYTYDNNGNMITDQNNGIGSAIIYNFMNLPSSITKGTNTVNYIYDGTGRKLSQFTAFNTSVKETNYSGEFQYENNLLQFVNHEEGRVILSETEGRYTYHGETIDGVTASNTALATVTLNGTEKYLRVTSNGTVAQSGVFPVGGTFNVQAGEQYIIRAKGYRTGTSAVYLMIKVNGVAQNWPGATLASAVAVESWTEQKVTIPTGGTTLQVGVTWNAVTASQQFFLNELEVVRISENVNPEYQYYLKDHLGNVRLTFTATPDEEVGVATLETINASAEQSKFLNYSEAITVNYDVFDHTYNGTTGATYYSTRLTGGNTNAIYGLAKSLSVMPGDTINMEVFAKYLDPNSTNWTPALTAFMSAMSGGTAPPGTIVDGGSPGSIGSGSFAFAGMFDHSTEGGTAPKAYLNFIVFDKDFNPLIGESGYSRITTASRETGNNVAHDKLERAQLIIKEPGYVYIYLSNENETAVEVYFDDFRVEHIKSPVVQMNDYYPFGMAFNRYERENSTVNKYLFNNGSELQTDLNLGWYSTLFRSYNPTIGRFLQPDPLADFFSGISPYNFAENNPILFGDPLGLSPSIWQRIKAFFGIGRLSGTRAAGNQEYVKPVARSKGKPVAYDFGMPKSLPTENPRPEPAQPVQQVVEQEPEPQDEPVVYIPPAPIMKPKPQLKPRPQPKPLPPSNPKPDDPLPFDVEPGGTLRFNAYQFEFLKTNLYGTPANDKLISDLIRVLKSSSSYHLEIRGNINADPDNAFERWLNDDFQSKIMNDRAKAIYKALRDAGIPASQLKASPGEASNTGGGNQSATFILTRP